MREASASSLPPGSHQPSTRAAWLPSDVRTGQASGEQPVPRSTRPAMPAVSYNAEPSIIPGYDDEERATDISLAPDFPSILPPVSTKDHPLLLRLDSVHAGQVFTLTGETATLGRHASNDIVLQDSGISRFHARFKLEDKQLVVQDLESKNGIYHHRQRVESASLKEGDQIRLGPRVTFRYILTDQKQEELLKRLYLSSTRDALTGIYNRRHFDERLKAEVAFALRHHQNLGLLLFDIDHFKQVNDRWGHPGGDAVLKQVAKSIAQQLRNEDVLARTGGEEFGVILRGVAAADAVRLAERLRSIVAAVPALVEGRPVGVTISVGCAELGQCQSAEALIRLTDRRLYAAKRSGRNRVVANG